MNATLLSPTAFISIFISQQLSLNYFHHLVHSSVARLFNLEYISTSMLWIVSIFPSLASLQPQDLFQVTHEGLSLPELATTATAAIFSLIFKPFSIFFHPLNCSFSIFLFCFGFFHLVHFVPHFSSHLGSYPFGQQPQCAKSSVRASTETWPRM